MPPISDTVHTTDMRRAFVRRVAHFAAWTERYALGNRLVVLLALVALGMGGLTYAAMTGRVWQGGGANTLILLLNIGLVILLFLIAAAARRVVSQWGGSRRQGGAGSTLQTRLVGLFSMLVAFPALITTVFSVGLFYYGVHGWFDARVRTAVDESLAVATAYLNEHQQVLRADVQAMATDLSRDSLMLASNPKALEKMLNTQSFLRNFTEVGIYDGDHNALAQSGFSFAGSAPQEALFDRARSGEVAVQTSEGDDRLEAMVRLNGYGDEAYLYAGRSVDPRVLEHLDTTRAAVSQYQELEAKSARIQITITVLYLAVVVLLMTMAIWFAIVLARRMAEPISAVVSAAERMREGDMSARVGETKGLDEFVHLGRAFNRMTQEIEAQRNELIEANRRLDYRRRFTETVLGGVSTGIMGVDGAGVVTLANPAAGNLLGIPNEKLIGEKLADVLPDTQLQSGGKRGEHEASVLRRDGARRRFLVRVSGDMPGEGGQASVIAFDDITDLVAAQKSAAWADVARRIAHEIKNPLTPIQLSAERIKRKYLDQMADDKDRDILAKCTDTIVRHVDDIKSMVNAFSNFAKMPDPVMAPLDMDALVTEVVSLQKSAHAGIDVRVLHEGSENWAMVGDQQLIRQALINLIKNALEAVESIPSPKVAVRLVRDHDGIWLGVLDNGPGIPPDQRESVLEPYVTTKTKGTGLGLAIVKKIADDHGGRLSMDDPAQLPPELAAQYAGAHINLFFPVDGIA